MNILNLVFVLLGGVVGSIGMTSSPADIDIHRVYELTSQDYLRSSFLNKHKIVRRDSCDIECPTGGNILYYVFAFVYMNRT